MITALQEENLKKDIDLIFSGEKDPKSIKNFAIKLSNLNVIGGGKDRMVRVAEHFTTRLVALPVAESALFLPVQRLINIHLNADAKNAGTTLLSEVFKHRDENAVFLLLRGYSINVNTVQDENGNTLLHLAAKKGDFKMLKRLVDLGAAEVNAKNKSGATALHLAAEAGHREILEFLLARHANLHALDENDNAPSHYAAKNGQVDTLGLLKEYGANLEIANKEGNTALHFAVINGHPALVEYLLKDNANVTARDKNGLIPLHLAGIAGDEKICRQLVARSPETVSIKIENDGDQLVHLAAFNGRNDIVLWLIKEHKAINARGNLNKTILHVAIDAQNEALSAYLLENGADVMAQDKNLATPLHYAAGVGNIRICRRLIDHKPKGADIYARNKNHNLPLHTATIENQVKVVELFIKDKKFDVNTPGEHHRTPLHLACKHSNVEMVRYLLDNKANVMARDDRNQLPIHLAAKEGNGEICELLMAAKSDISSSDKFGMSPMHLAAMTGKVEIMKLFMREDKAAIDTRVSEPTILNNNKTELNRNFKRTPLHLAAMNGHTEACKLLLEAKPNSLKESKDDKGYSPLDLMVMKGQTDTLNYFIKVHEPKVDINTCGFSGKSLLHIAAGGGQGKLVSYLLEEGVDVMARDKDDNTPLHDAAGEGKLEVCRLLVTHKLRNTMLYAKNKSQNMPLHIALIEKRDDVLYWFIDECRVDINCTGQAGKTVLHFLAEDEDDDEFMVQQLVERGADIHITSATGDTPLHYAMFGYDYEYQIKVAESLLQYGARPTIQNIPGVTALEMAKEDPDSLALFKNFSVDHKIGLKIRQKIHKVIFEESLHGTVMHSDLQGIVLQYAILPEEAKFLPKKKAEEQVQLKEQKQKIEDEVSEEEDELFSPTESEQDEEQDESDEEENSEVEQEQEESEEDELIAQIPALETQVVFETKLSLQEQKTTTSEAPFLELINLVEEGLLAYAKLGKPLRSLEASAQDIINCLPSPDSCQRYWKQLKKQYKVDPSKLDEVPKPSQPPKPKVISQAEVLKNIDPDSATLLAPVSIQTSSKTRVGVESAMHSPPVSIQTTSSSINATFFAKQNREKNITPPKVATGKDAGTKVEKKSEFK